MIQRPPVFEPKAPLKTPPNPLALAGIGTATLLVGILHETFSNPIRPIFSMFGIVPLAIGGAIGVAFLTGRHQIAGLIAYYVVIVGVAWYSLGEAGSVLAICVFAGCYNLARAALLYQQAL